MNTNEVEILDLNNEAELLEVGQEVLKEAEELKEEIKINSKEMVEELKAAYDSAVEAGHDKAARNIKKVLMQVDAVNNLEYFEGTVRSNITNKEFNAALKAARKKLGENKKYVFKDIRGLDKDLEAVVPDQFKAKIRPFLFKFYNYVAKKPLSGNAVYISQLISNLYKVGKEDCPEGFEDALYKKIEETVVSKG
jgi:hypothetical protein